MKKLVVVLVGAIGLVSLVGCGKLKAESQIVPKSVVKNKFVKNAEQQQNTVVVSEKEQIRLKIKKARKALRYGKHYYHEQDYDNAIKYLTYAKFICKENNLKGLQGNIVIWLNAIGDRKTEDAYYAQYEKEYPCTGDYNGYYIDPWSHKWRKHEDLNWEGRMATEAEVAQMKQLEIQEQEEIRNQRVHKILNSTYDDSSSCYADGVWIANNYHTLNGSVIEQNGHYYWTGTVINTFYVGSASHGRTRVYAEKRTFNCDDAVYNGEQPDFNFGPRAYPREKNKVLISETHHDF